jgi:hypothetical protein
MKEEKVKSYKELLADQNWYFESHKEANEVAFRYAVVCPEFKFSVVKRGDRFFVGMKDPMSKDSGYVNEP